MQIDWINFPKSLLVIKNSSKSSSSSFLKLNSLNKSSSAEHLTTINSSNFNSTSLNFLIFYNFSSWFSIFIICLKSNFQNTTYLLQPKLIKSSNLLMSGIPKRLRRRLGRLKFSLSTICLMWDRPNSTKMSKRLSPFSLSFSFTTSSTFGLRTSTFYMT